MAFTYSKFQALENDTNVVSKSLNFKINIYLFRNKYRVH
jgi:hypothetical protein